MEGNTVFISYTLISNGYTGNSYTQAIHCNYIKKIDLGTTDPYVQEISLNFPYPNDFKFLKNGINDEIGYAANKIIALVQLVDNTPFSSYADIKPDSTQWKQYDITSQISNYSTISGATFVLTPAHLTGVVFKISLLQYNNATVFQPYNLNYLNYPSASQSTALSFGDATYFFGNVTTKIKADVYTTDIGINLPLNEFNSSDNLTWNGVDSVYITEVGIYDSDKNLVAVGKLNDPVPKDATISRTIVFALDF